MVDTITWAASAAETDVDTTIEEHFHAYRIPESDPLVHDRVRRTARLRDRTLPHAPTGGGSDASAFAAKGLACLNLAIGVEHNHTPHERVTAAALEKTLDIAFRLADRAAASLMLKLRRGRVSLLESADDRVEHFDRGAGGAAALPPGRRISTADRARRAG